MHDHDEARRSRALDAWDFRAPFARFHIHWGEGDIVPAFEQGQAFAIALQELFLDKVMEVWAHREVLVTFSSERIEVGGGPAEREPAWVVVVAGRRRDQPAADVERNVLEAVTPGAGAVVQVLIHARTGEVVLGTVVPVTLRQ